MNRRTHEMLVVFQSNRSEVSPQEFGEQERRSCKDREGRRNFKKSPTKLQEMMRRCQRVSHTVILLVLVLYLVVVQAYSTDGVVGVSGEGDIKANMQDAY
eukprot:GHVS01073938.1.p1 GENE.GHVS01073938.1~~GHVS01073938.1.p1  ORF type:complete len:100 (+),score=12.44 GHVS01073938.1:216-515(+)